MTRWRNSRCLTKQHGTDCPSKQYGFSIRSQRFDRFPGTTNSWELMRVGGWGLELHGTQSAPTVVVYSKPRVERVVVHRPARLVAFFSLDNLRCRVRGMGFCVLGVECFVAPAGFGDFSSYVTHRSGWVVDVVTKQLARLMRSVSELLTYIRAIHGLWCSASFPR